MLSLLLLLSLLCHRQILEFWKIPCSFDGDCGGRTSLLTFRAVVKAISRIERVFEVPCTSIDQVFQVSSKKYSKNWPTLGIQPPRQPSKQARKNSSAHLRSKQSGIKRVQVVHTVWWSLQLKPSSAESSPQSSCYSHAPAKTSVNKYSSLNEVQTSIYKQPS